MSSPTQQPSVSDLAAGILNGDRAMLARAITLVESTRHEHQERARDLLQELLPHCGKSRRLGITGVPGVGKSTTIDQLGMNLIGAGHRVAVLAVDPTSKRTGGSILGDKTRMNRLAGNTSGFVRPSPTSGTLGGVARKTRETMALVEAAGYDVVIVETVGVGQSEVAVAEMVDFFLVLLLPGGGDELQGIKKGIIEIADMLAINKSDGDNVSRAERSAADYRNALALLSPSTPLWQPPVVTISGRDNVGLVELWKQITSFYDRMEAGGELPRRRASQAVSWMHDMLTDRLLSVVRNTPAISKQLSDLETQVYDGVITPAVAVEKVATSLGSLKL